MILRRRTSRLPAVLTALAVLVVAGCSGSAADTSPSSGGPLKIGLIWPQSGPYQAIGADLERGWQLYLDTNGGTLGGRTVEVVTADEAEGKQSALTAVRKLLDKDEVTVIVGTGTADAVESIKTGPSDTSVGVAA